MHTARLLTVSPSMHCARGCVAGVYQVPGGGIPACTEAEPPPPPWTEFLTHATENITLPQTSFAGGNKSSYFYL